MTMLFAVVDDENNKMNRRFAHSQGVFSKKTLHLLNYEHLSMLKPTLVTSALEKRRVQTPDVVLVSFDYRADSLDDTPHSNVSKFGRGGAHGHKPNQLFQDNLVGHENLKNN